MSELKHKLPHGWAWTTLGEVTRINQRMIPDGIDDDTPVSFIGMAAIEEETGKFDASNIRLLRMVRRGYTSFKDGDILFAKITPCMENGKSAVVRNLISGLGFGSTEFHLTIQFAGSQRFDIGLSEP